MKNLIKNKEGITLIALIITIIVMLILVSVTITIALKGSLFKYSQSASDKHKIAQYKEEIWYLQQEAKMDSIINGGSVLEKTRSFIIADSLFENAGIGVIVNDEFNIQTKEGFKFKVKENDITYEGKSNEPIQTASSLNPTIYIEENVNEFGCVHDCTLHFSIDMYDNVLDYWLKEKATLTQKESYGLLMYMSIYGANSTKSAMEANQITYSSEELDEIILNSAYHPEFIYLVSMGTDDKISTILELWEDYDSSHPADTIEDVLKYMVNDGTPTTLAEQATKHHCTEDSGIDLVLYSLIMNTNTTLPTSEITLLDQTLQTQCESSAKYGPNITVTLPDGTTVIGEKLITFDVNENKEYTFGLTQNGITTLHSVDVTEIHHAEHTGGDGFQSEGYEYIDSNQHRHYKIYACDAIEYGSYENHEYSLSYNNQNDETHDEIYTCECGAIYEVNNVPHNFEEDPSREHLVYDEELQQEVLKRLYKCECGAEELR